MKQLTSSEWIAHFLATDPPRSKSLVMTIFGDAIAPHGGAVWLGSLIELLAPFGVNDRLLRTSVFRLAQEGWLVASRDGRRSSYAILPQALPRFERANRRIYAPLDVHWDGSWTLLLARQRRDRAPTARALRKELEWEGYAQLAPGVFGHPAGDAEVLRRNAGARIGVRGQAVRVQRAPSCRSVPARPLRELVGRRLGPVGRGRRATAGSSTSSRRCWRCWTRRALAPEQAFVIRTLLIHAYRRVQLHDPMLPIELLPDPWPGVGSVRSGARAVPG